MCGGSLRGLILMEFEKLNFSCVVEEVERLVDVLKEIEIGGDQGLLAHMERLSLVSLDSGTNTPVRSE